MRQAKGRPARAPQSFTADYAKGKRWTMSLTWFVVGIFMITVGTLIVADRAIRRGAKSGYAFAAVITAMGGMIAALSAIMPPS